MKKSFFNGRCFCGVFLTVVCSLLTSGETLSGSPLNSGDDPQLTVKLSAGVALPQTLPGGTAMTFSVDYRITKATIQKGNKYGWVFKPSKGQPFVKPVKLSTKGTLQAIVPQLKPNQRPFKCYLVEVTPNPHNGCRKFKQRFGQDAFRFVQAKPTRDRNLRGIYWKVVEPGEARVGALIQVLSRA